MLRIKVFFGRKTVRMTFTSLLLAAALFTGLSIFYVTFYYAAVMPRFPQPEKGRIHPIHPDKVTLVYVDDRELELRDLVLVRVLSAYGAAMLLYFGVGTSAGWWGTGPQPTAAK